VYRASLSRRLVSVVAPCSTVAPTGGVIREFRAADTGRKGVPTVRAPRMIGQFRIRTSNVLAMLLPIHSLTDPQKVPGGPIGSDVHIRAVE
jgi:hypothetical protein